MSDVKSIYHYCSVETFLSIIQNKTLRLSDINKTNDYMEKRWINNFIVIILKEKLDEFNINIDLEECYFYNYEIDNHLQYYIKKMQNKIFDQSPILITCFSEEKDKLSQWRAYGQDGTGISIGFNYKKINKLNGENNINILVEKVIYEESKQKKKLGDLIEDAIRYIEELFEREPIKVYDDFSEYFKEEFDSFCDILIRKIEKIYCRIKNPAFNEEKEIRIIYSPELPNKEGFEYSEIKEYFNVTKRVDEYIIEQIKFNCRNNELIAFCDLNFSELINENIITEIIIGPKSKITENDIYYLLMSNDIDAERINITRSKATYR